MRFTRFITAVIFIAALFMLLLLPGCIGGSGEVNKDKNFWFTAPPDIFRTDDMERAQQEIPFTIILPKYLPDDIEPQPNMIVGPIKGTRSEQKTSIQLYYQCEDEENKYISIYELNEPASLQPASNSGRVYLDFVGIQVLETLLPTSSDIVSHSLKYSWNMDGRHFTVYVDGYDKEEARKVVASMIE